MVDFDVEINNHLQWRAIIESVVSGDVSMEIHGGLIASDKDCQLGRWLYSSESASYEGNFHFNLLIADHKKFHLLSSEIVAAYKQGDFQKTHKLLDEFYFISDKVIDTLKELKELELNGL